MNFFDSYVNISSAVCVCKYVNIHVQWDWSFPMKWRKQTEGNSNNKYSNDDDAMAPMQTDCGEPAHSVTFPHMAITALTASSLSTSSTTKQQQ